MNHRYLSPLLLLLAVTLLGSLAGSQAPGDKSSSCNTPDVPNTIKLLDSRDYEDLNNPFDLLVRWNNSGPPCMQQLTGCTSNTELAEFQTQSIRYDEEAPNAMEIGIEVNFTFMDSSPGCPGTLQFFFTPTSSVDSPVTPTISCESTSPQTMYFSVSSLGVQNTFTVTTRALVGASAYCVDITQLRVHVQQCPEASNGLATYPLTVSGTTENGTCVENSVPASGSTLSATCGRDGGYDFGTAGECECNAGYGLNLSTCQVCDPGTFKATAGNTVCQSCPSNSDNVQTPDPTQCACDAGYARTNPSNFGLACDVCDVGHFMSSPGVCEACPSGSSNTSPTATSCQCTGSTTTADGSSTTTADPCGGSTCNNDLYFDTISLSCKMCQYQSTSSNSASVSCDCNTGYVDGSATTTTANGCQDCAANYYETSTTPDGSVCGECPANSRRALAPPAAVCPCLDDTNYARMDTNPSSDCLVLFGFTVEDLTVTESSPGTLTIDLPATSATVSVSVQGTHPDVTVDPRTFDFDTARSQTITVTLSDDDTALEPDQSFTLSLSVTSGPGMIAGGSSNVDITLEDDDPVMVGFQISTVRFNESDGSVTVSVEKSADIASPLTLLVSGAPGDIDVSENVEFSSGPDNNQAEVTINIPNNENDNDDVTFTLTLQQIDPTNNRVIIGTDAPYDGTIQVTILDDDPSEPSDGLATGTIIGIAVGAAGGAVLAACICLVCVLVCRFHVNRQGYYATYEDKAAEPSMIRYSASLRSISSQTVVPAEGKPTATAKENEFYV